MGLKRVSFKVAKAIKEAGYPQGRTKDVYVIQTVSDFTNTYPYGVCIRSSHNFPSETTADVPTYIEVWLWLWREKKISIELSERIKYVEANVWNNEYAHNPVPIIDIDDRHNYQDPEEAIIAAIEYLVTNNLIK